MSVFDEIRNQLDIVQVISEYVELRKKGKNFVGLSPFQTENTPSFVVSPEKQIFKDFSSGNGGDVIKFIQLVENKDSKSIIGYITKKYDLKVSSQITQKMNNPKILETTSQFYNFNLLNTKQGEEAINYLERRKLSLEIIYKFKLGLALESGLEEVLSNSGVTIREMLDLHLIGLNSDATDTYDLFSNRIIFPIENINNKIVGFGSRIYKNGDTRAKYINSSDSSSFNKSKVLYNLNRAQGAIKKNNFVIISEGYMDVIKLDSVHITNAVGIMGTGLTNDHIQLIKKYTNNVILLLDGDMPGQASANKYIPLLKKNGIKVVNIQLENNFDPDEYIVKNGKEKLYELISQARNKLGLEKNNANIDDRSSNGLSSTNFENYQFEPAMPFPDEYEINSEQVAKQSESNKAIFKDNKQKPPSKTSSKEYEKIKKMLNNWEAMVIFYALKKPEQFKELDKLISSDFFLIDPDLHEIYIEMKNYYVKENEFKTFQPFIASNEQMFSYILINKKFETIWQHVNSLLDLNEIAEELIQRIEQTKKAYPLMRNYEMQLLEKENAGRPEIEMKVTNVIRRIIKELKTITE